MASETCLIFGGYTGEPGVPLRLESAIFHDVLELGTRRSIVGPGPLFDRRAALGQLTLCDLSRPL